MTDAPLCPKCGAPKAMDMELDRDRGFYVETWECPLEPHECEIRSLRAQLSAEQTAHAETRKALEEADEALIVSMPDDASLDSNGDRRRIWYRGFQAALARSAQRKEKQ